MKKMMTSEEKQLILKDLCGRVPYGVKGEYQWKGNTPYNRELDGRLYNELSLSFNSTEDSSFIPYLRPMSSMTESEKMEVNKLGVCDDGSFHNDIYDIGISMEEAFTAISWFLERHFDINYLIEKGLALEAPEDMYKTE